MKKILPLVAAVAMLGAVSCKKEYTCTCTTTDGFGFNDPVITVKTDELKKKEVDDWCADSGPTFFGDVTTCVLSN
jgi:hypothetical protein